MSYRLIARVSCVVLFVVSTIGAAPGAAVPARVPSSQAPATPFAALVARLSEPGGYFGGDNLISNEQSYLRIMTALDQSGLKGGVYIGVGPDQNFSYIAQLVPDVAFMLDLRRDNLLLHLLFKSLFSMAPTRSAYLRLLTGRAPPADAGAGRGAGIAAIIADVEAAPALTTPALAALRARIDAALTRTGVTLSAEDRRTIQRFHQTYISEGLDLVFQAHGQPRRSYYPSLRDLLLETDTNGRQRSFLASDAAYQVIRTMQAGDRIVPVVGDVSGRAAMTAIAGEMLARRLPLRAFYISNVEFYLFSNGTFDAFAANLARLPLAPGALMLRSVFPGGWRGPLPRAAPGHYSTSLTQPVDAMLADVRAGRYRVYGDLVVASR